MSKHTPGPWTARKDNGSQTVAYEILAGPDGRRVAIGPRWLKEHQAECEANARLIAAAPDLLAACKWAEHALAPFSKEPQEKSGITMLRAALSKTEK